MRDPLPPDEIAENLRRLADEMPADVLPDGPARLALVWLISSGHDVYAYWSGGHITGTPVVWLQPLADTRPEKDGRVAISEWVTGWRALLGEMGEMGVTMPEPEEAAAAKEATA